MNSQHLGVASGFMVMALAHTMVFAQLIAPPLGNLPGQNLPGQQGGNQNQGQGGQNNNQGAGGQQGNNNTNANAIVSLTRPKGVATFTPGYARLNTRAMSSPRYQKGAATDPAILGQGVPQGAPRGFITVSTNSQGGLGGVAIWGLNFQGGPGVAQPGPGVTQLGGGFPGGGGGFPGVVMFSLRNPVTDSAANPASPAPRASYVEQRLRLRLQQAPAQ